MAAVLYRRPLFAIPAGGHCFFLPSQHTDAELVRGLRIGSGQDDGREEGETDPGHLRAPFP
jgi:hypothetical protein